MPQDLFDDGLSPELTGGTDRRSDARYQAVRWIGKLTNGTAQELCVVRNICSTALVVQVFSTHAIGDRVSIALHGDQLLEGEIVWAGDDTAEVRFFNPIDLPAAVSAHAPAGTASRPGVPRLEIPGGGTLRLGNERFPVEVRDLSQGGVKIATSALPRLGEEALLDIDGLGELPGLVRWCEGGHVGIAFLQAVPFDELTGWIVAREKKAEDSNDTGDTQRRWPRYNMFLKSWMQLSGVLTPVEIYIHNLCRGGLRVTCRRGLHPGEHVVVGLGRAGDVRGSVVWTDKEHAGIAFTRTLDPDHARQPFASRSVAPIMHHRADGRRPGLRSQ